MKRLYGITGFKGAGKDTVGNFICKYLPNTVIMSYADSLKDAVSSIFCWDRELLNGSTPESRKWREEKDEYWSKIFDKDITPRYILQIMGTEVCRNHLHKDIWVNSLIAKYNKMDKNVVVTDVRFRNEIEAIKRMGGTILRVEREEHPIWWNLANEYNFSGVKDISGKYLPLLDIHQSERDWIGIDKPEFIFDNKGSLEELENKVKEFIIQK